MSVADVAEQITRALAAVATARQALAHADAELTEARDIWAALFQGSNDPETAELPAMAHPLPRARRRAARAASALGRRLAGISGQYRRHRSAPGIDDTDEARRHADDEDLRRGREAMVALDAWYDHDGPTRVTTAAELDAVLDTVAAMDGPTLVAFNATPDVMAAGLLNIGLDGAAGVGVAHHAERGRGYYSHGDASNAETRLYYYMGSDTEFPPNSEVPLADVRRAAHEYFATGALPTAIRWQLDDRSSV